MALNRDVRAILFDLDGTLADTFPLIVRAWNHALTPVTGKTYSDEEVIARFGIPDGQMLKRELGEGYEDAIGDAYHQCYERSHEELVSPFEGVPELLAELKQRKIPRGVMTGKGRLAADITLRKLGWEELFGGVITGDEVKKQKPEPEGLLSLAKQLDVGPRECAFVGDSPADVRAGQAAKMVTVAAAWPPVYHDEVKKLRPDLWAETPADVLKLL